MAQGILIDNTRPKSKKQVKEMVDMRPDLVRIEATSLFGDEYDGSVASAPNGTYFFVGPDPYTKRNFYGQIIVKDGKVTVK